MRIVEFTHHRDIGPGLNLLGKEDVIVPYKRPCLAIVDQLLQLPCRHGSLTPKDVCGDIINSGHSVDPFHWQSIECQIAQGTRRIDLNICSRAKIECKDPIVDIAVRSGQHPAARPVAGSIDCRRVTLRPAGRLDETYMIA